MIIFRNGALQIPFCIIDEAAQATELLTLVPTLLRIQRLILVGDPQQLPPTILSNVFMIVFYLKKKFYLINRFVILFF